MKEEIANKFNLLAIQSARMRQGKRNPIPGMQIQCKTAMTNARGCPVGCYPRM